MIIFGTRNVQSCVSRGVFYCPHCQARMLYELIEPTQYFHLFFIPLIPINKHNRYVECQTCKNAYRPVVLEYDPDPERARAKLISEYNVLLLRAMCLVANADHMLAQADLEAIRQIYQHASRVEIEVDTVKHTVQIVKADPQRVCDDLGRLAPQLSENGRELIVRACIITGGRSGHLPDTERYFAQGVALAMGMSPAHYKGLLDDVGFHMINQMAPG